ncbi:MAG: type II secretion system protein [Clostridiales bacterium]
MKINKKGISLIEVVLVISILGVISSVIYSVFQFGISSYYSGSRQVYQQDKVVDIIQILRSHVEEAKTVKYDSVNNLLVISDENLSDVDMIDNSSKNVKCWKFDDNKLKFRNVGETSYEDLVFDLDTSKSSFEINSEDKLIISIKPLQLNKQYKNRNITEAVVMEFSVRYKVAE